ncbi:uncharacterized protein LOC119513585 [Choloepus didactylus]|uniref:uncharacterized protein LOC119513585 n=1 Tax=Choloepus didactylus TaxID=27675 RepID=UPI00189D87D2|nr:uncharacterized protein LOC119513585 [Choloepus didactylus]
MRKGRGGAGPRGGKIQGHWPRRNTGGHPAGSALQSLSPRHRQQPLLPPLPNHPSDTGAAASQHVGRRRCCNRGGRLGKNTDRVSHRGDLSGGRRGRLARTQIVEAGAAATSASPQAREEGLRAAAPDTLCTTGSLGPHQLAPSFPDRLPGVATALPPLAPAGTASSRRQQLPHPAGRAGARARAQASHPFTGPAAGRARASWYRGTLGTRLLRDWGNRWGMEWVGEGCSVSSPLRCLNHLRPRNHLSQPSLWKRGSDFVKRTLCFSLRRRIWA